MRTLMIVNAAVLVPVPSASMSRAIPLNPGLRNINRKPDLISSHKFRISSPDRPRGFTAMLMACP
jgi:hypothetical protein